MHSSWKRITLGECCKIYDGVHQTPEYVNIGVPFYSVENITNDEFVNTKYITQEAHLRNTQKYKIEKGDVLMTRIGSIGVCKYIDWDVNASFYVSLALLKCNKDILLPEYLVQFSQSDYFKKEIMSHSLENAVPMKINLGKIRDVSIYIPDITEQKQISNILNNIDISLKLKRNLLEKKKNIKFGLMQKLLTNPKWEKVKLGTCCKIIMGQSPEGVYYNDLGKGLPLIQGNADIANRKTIITTYTSKITKTCDEGDIILSVRAPVGAVGKATFKACIGRGVCSIKFPNDFLFYYFEYIEDKWEQYSTGSTFDSINGKTLKNIEIPLPNEYEQEKISKVFKDFDYEIDSLVTEIEKLELIKKGLIQKFFFLDKDINDDSE